MGTWAAHGLNFGWNLVGREGELGLSRSALDAGGGVLLMGDPGVGKTSIARCLLDSAGRRADYEVLWLVASASGPAIPFGAFAPLVPDIGGEPGRHPDPFFLLQTLRRTIVERAKGRHLLIGVDDAHRLDDQSATLLYQLIASKEAQAVIAARAGQPLCEALHGLWKESLVERIDVQPLGRDDSLELAAIMLSGDPSGRDGLGAHGAQLATELAEALLRVGGGNPLYLRELILFGRQSGRIYKDHDQWRLLGRLEVGPRLAELLQQRIGQINSDELATLEVVAFADPLPLNVLSLLAGSLNISSLQRQGLLKIERSQGEQQVRTGHPLYSEAIREATPAPRATEIGLQLAKAFEADGRMSTHILRIVTWRLDGGDAPGPDLLVAASNRAAERQDWELSRRLAQAALDAGGGPEAAFALADSLRSLGRYEEALAALGDQEGTGDDQIGRVAVLRAFVLFWGLGRAVEADETLAKAESRMVDESSRTWVEAVRAGILNFSGRPADAVAAARPLLERAESAPRAAVAIRSALATGLALSGHADEAVAIAEECMHPDLQGAGGPLSVTWSLTARATAYRMSGRLQELEDLAKSQYQLALQLGDRMAHGSAAAALGWVALPRGELTVAVRRFRESAAALEMADSLGSRIHTLCGLAEALAVSGDPDGAEAALADVKAKLRHAGAPAARVGVAEAWVTASRGDVSRAMVQLRDAAESARMTGQVAYELLALSASVRLGSDGATRRLTDLAKWVEGPLVQAVARHAVALSGSTRSGDALDEAAENYATLTLNLYAAETAAQASRAHSDAGNARRAAASAARARTYLPGDEGPQPLGLSLALTPPGLTRREKDVAFLAGRGLSSQAIATQLCLSVRTVESHLARVYFKLGISRRSQLPAALMLGSGEAEAS